MARSQSERSARVALRRGAGDWVVTVQDTDWDTMLIDPIVLSRWVEIVKGVLALVLWGFC
jgi:hypothetical protein